MGQVSGKVAVVTGGASGIGEACAETLAREGASVLITDIDDTLGKGVVERIAKAGGKAHYQRHDVRDEAAWPGIIADAEKRFGLVYKSVPDHKQCECGAILRGVKRPTDCKLFGSVCTPENPMGSCMVSSEGACAAHYTYGRFRDIPVVAA